MGTHGIRQRSPVLNGFSGTGTVPGRYPGVPKPMSFLRWDPRFLSATPDYIIGLVIGCNTHVKYAFEFLSEAEILHFFVFVFVFVICAFIFAYAAITLATQSVIN